MSSNKPKASTPAIAEQKGKGKVGASSKIPAQPAAKDADVKGAEEQGGSDISFGTDDAPTGRQSGRSPGMAPIKSNENPN